MKTTIQFASVLNLFRAYKTSLRAHSAGNHENFKGNIRVHAHRTTRDHRIIAVLAALLLPALAGARAQAHRINLFNAMRQLAVATRDYAEDNDQILPREEAIDSRIVGNACLEPNANVWYNSSREKNGSRQWQTMPFGHHSDGLLLRPASHLSRPQSRSNTTEIVPEFSIAMNSKLNCLRILLDSTNSTLTSPAARRCLSRAGCRVGKTFTNSIPINRTSTTAQGFFQPVFHAPQSRWQHRVFDGHVATMPAHKVIDPLTGREFFLRSTSFGRKMGAIRPDFF
jgi:type II secretory pathway pseudopilin PulG